MSPLAPGYGNASISTVGQRILSEVMMRDAASPDYPTMTSSARPAGS